MNKKVTWRDLLVSLILLLIVMFIAMFVATNQNSKEIKTRPNTVNVDSLLTTNDSIKVVIKYIDSTKHEEIEKVLKLDNDSTLELFKQLVRE